MTCKRGHEFRGDENYRARQGWCPVCFREVQSRYTRSEKGKARSRAYDRSDKEKKRVKNARTNARRMFVGDLYVGSCGFSVSETEAILDGSTD